MSKKYRQQYKRRTLPSIVKQKEKITIQNPLLKLEKQVNQRLKSLQKKGATSSLALRDLQSNLSLNMFKSFNIKKGRVKISGEVLKSKTKSTAVAKHLNKFLNSKLSTKKGIEEIRQKTIKSLSKTLLEQKKDRYTDEELDLLEDKLEDITKEQSEAFVRMFGDKDYKFFTNNFNIDASEFMVFIDEAIEKEMTLEEFDTYMNNYIMDLKDTDYKEYLTSIYNKYVNY